MGGDVVVIMVVEMGWVGVVDIVGSTEVLDGLPNCSKIYVSETVVRYLCPLGDHQALLTNYVYNTYPTHFNNHDNYNITTH